MTEKKGFKITYDTFFKMIFDPYDNPEFLEIYQEIAEFRDRTEDIMEFFQMH